MKERKVVRLSEALFALGILLLSLATVLMAKSGFGVSQTVAPIYVLAEKLSVSYGVMTYLYYGALVLILCLIYGRVKLKYPYTFATAVLFGLGVDFWTAVLSFLTPGSLGTRILLFCMGLPINSLALAFMLQGYFPPQAPELFVKEIARLVKKDMYRVKYAYDLASLLLSVTMSLLFFRELRYIGVGTFICAFTNGPLIGFFGRQMEKRWDITAALPKVEHYFTMSKATRMQERAARRERREKHRAERAEKA